MLHNDRRPEGLSWASLQKEIATALMDPTVSIPSCIDGKSARRLKRFAVYRNNVKASLVAALGARFPVVERLVGSEFFRAMAVAFIDAHPPETAILSQFGKALPAFLESFEPAADLTYLPDVAELEWLRTTAYNAADATPLNATALAVIEPAAFSDLRVTLHPSLGLVISESPIVSIWATNTHDDEVSQIAADSAAEAAIVTRPHLDVLVTAAPRATCQFIALLATGATLGAAYEFTEHRYADLNISDALVLMYQTGAVVGLHHDSAGKLTA